MSARRRAGPSASLTISLSLEDLSRPAQDFLRSVATGSSEHVRVIYSILNSESLAELERVELLRPLLTALQREVEWRPSEGAVVSLPRIEDTKLKELRRLTAREVARVRGWARQVIASTLGTSAPNLQGAHYRAAVRFTEILRQVPGVQEVYLFGSVSRGTERADSDVDLLIVRGRGVTDTKYRHLLWDILEPIADMIGFPTIRIRTQPGSERDPWPTLQLMVVAGRPKDWSHHGLSEGELLNLWRLDTPQALHLRSKNPSHMLSLIKGSLAVIVYETRWHWLGEDPEDGFSAIGLMEVYDKGHIQLREIELEAHWNLCPRVIICSIERHGERCPELARPAQQLARQAVLRWISEKTGVTKPLIEFRRVE